jgi:uncharacterized protein Smg (DUF494 family)
MEEGLEGEARDDMVESLMRQGHNPTEIHAALNIVEKIQQRLDSPQVGLPRPCNEKFFVDLEEFHLSPEVRGYLGQLVGMGVLDPVQREEIVERTLLMETEEVTLEEVEYMVEEILADKPKVPGEFDETVSDYYH